MPEYERTIYQLQGMGWRVVIAHPERYDAIRQNPELARRLVELDCDLQASADFIKGGRLGNSGKTAKRIFQMGLYRFIASDAHKVEHYDFLKKACQCYGVKPSHMR